MISSFLVSASDLVCVTGDSGCFRVCLANAFFFNLLIKWRAEKENLNFWVLWWWVMVLVVNSESGHGGQEETLLTCIFQTHESIKISLSFSLSLSTVVLGVQI